MELRGVVEPSGLENVLDMVAEETRVGCDNKLLLATNLNVNKVNEMGRWVQTSKWIEEDDIS